MSVATVAGMRSVSELGVTLVHEHLRTAREPVRMQFPHLYDESAILQRVVAQVRTAQGKGLQTICDPTVLGLGRDIRFIEAVARESGVNVVAATGVYTYDRLPPYFAMRSVDAMVDVLAADVEQGIQGTAIKAGFFKCATDKPGMTPDVEKVLRAVARAHRRTGAPIMTHTDAATEAGLLQLEIFQDEGVDPSRVLVGHCGDTADLGYLETLLGRGAYIGLDRFGMDDFLPTADRTRTVVELVRRGWGAQLMLSQDYVCELDYEFPLEISSKRGDWRLDFVLDTVMPALAAAGIDSAEIDAMVRANVHRWLEPSAPY